MKRMDINKWEIASIVFMVATMLAIAMVFITIGKLDPLAAGRWLIAAIVLVLLAVLCNSRV